MLLGLEDFSSAGKPERKMRFFQAAVETCKPGLTTKLSLLPLLSFGHLGRQEQIVCDLFPCSFCFFPTCVFHQSTFHTSCVSLVDAGICGIFPTSLLKGGSVLMTHCTFLMCNNFLLKNGSAAY